MLAACGPNPAPVTVQPGVPLGQAQVVQPQDPQQYAQSQAQQQVQQQQQYAQPAPVIVQQPAYAQQPVVVQNHDSGVGVGTAVAAGVAGLVIGNMLSNSGSSNNGGYNRAPNVYNSDRTVTNKTINNTTIIHSAPTPAAAPAPIPQQKMNVISNIAPTRPTQQAAAVPKSIPVPAPAPQSMTPSRPSKK